ncbi:SRPBCC family protein [Peribacillus frigoritolerans]|uniref:SRPBCC family protein n=1 Tax=Peribacillus frigoritolerans TaxID=450367 RepID=UPI0010596AC1|nr:SRPBCC family protein [Peribacillus frigoritolerans]TDL76366.1 cell division protein [Peribacillus frigoritolerans]
MPVIKNTILIKAPIEVCFDLARNVEVHTRTTEKTKEKAVGGVTTGLLKEGDTVEWEAVHFSIKQRLTAKITEMNRPYEFKDIMVKGAFKSFNHTHTFAPSGNETVMTDRFEYQSPLGCIGKAADLLFLERYMKNFLSDRAKELKKTAEAK